MILNLSIKHDILMRFTSKRSNKSTLCNKNYAQDKRI